MPADTTPCTFSEPEARLPGLEPALICPYRDIYDLDWLFVAADMMPIHLPVSGGSLDQPAWVMDAIEAVMLGRYQWHNRKENKSDGADR